MNSRAYDVTHSASGRGGRRTPEAEAEIDLALAVLCTRFSGQQLTHRQIAAATGMSHGGSFAIEQAALRKLHHRLRYGADSAFGREVSA